MKSEVVTADERVEQVKNRFAREMQALCNEGPYGACMAMAICIQLLRIIFVETNQPPELIEQVARTIATPGTSTDFLTQRLS